MVDKDNNIIFLKTLMRSPTLCKIREATVGCYVSLTHYKENGH